MQNTSVQAAAEGLPAITRRLFLRNAAVASMAGAVVAAPAAASAASAAPAEVAEVAENPALIDLWRQFRFAETDYREAKEALGWLADEYKHLWPRAPQGALWRGTGGDPECDIAGRPYRDEQGFVIFVKTRAELADTRQWVAARGPSARCKDKEKERQRHLKWQSNWLAELDEAEAYLDRIDEVRTLAGMDAAHSRVRLARDKCEELASSVSKERAFTLYGVRLQADVVLYSMEALHISERSPGFLGDTMRLAISVLDATEHLRGSHSKDGGEA